MPRGKNLFIVIYLIIQLALPLRGFLYDKFENLGNFSWNMYSRAYRCQTQYRLNTPQGETHWPVHNDYFNREGSFQYALNADFLPEYHRWLCDKFRQEGKLGSMQGYVICSLDGGPLWELVDRSVDLCTAPNYGAKDQREVFGQ